MNAHKKAMELINGEHEIVNILFKYIDRMIDATDEDPLEKSAAEFLKEVQPTMLGLLLVSASID